jgi:4-diphosphocytidyl-2-C-methyl-D-erythritol kinase
VPLRDVLARPVPEWRGRLGNDFERTVFARYPSIAAVKEKLYEAGAVYASMSGSGATVYGIFAQPAALQDHFPAEYTIWPAL